MSLRLTVSIVALATALAACTQGSEIESPGATNSGTPPSGGGGGAGGGGGVGMASCPSGFPEGTAVAEVPLTICNITGSILTNLSVPKVDGVAYRINGRVEVGADMGPDGLQAGGVAASLTLAPGVTLFGESDADVLIVNRGSRMVADGLSTAPIVFTSSADLQRQYDTDPTNDDGDDFIGEWAGVILLGQAPISLCEGGGTPGTVTCENKIEGVTNPIAEFGGDDPNDDSGVLRYVQVRHAGDPLAGSGDDLNGISFGGVGRNTIVDYVQVHNNHDDGVEFFGGTVNVKHLVLTGNDDDNVDTDLGYQGNIQYLVVVQRALNGDNIFEASNAGDPASPASDYNVSNFTIVGGGGGGNAWRINSRSIGQYVNGVVDHPRECFRWESDAGDGVAGFNAASDPTFDSVFFACAGGVATGSSDVAAATAAIANDPNNVPPASAMSTLSQKVFNGSNESAVTPFAAHSIASFFDNTPYIGAFSPAETETNNWASGWTHGLFPPPACPSGTTDAGVEINGVGICNVVGPILSDLTLTRGKIYRIAGRVEVGEDQGPDAGAPLAGATSAALTIEPGVTLFGASEADVLIVNRGSQIFADGTAANPIILTSEADLRGTQPDPVNAIGEWAGFILLGRAPISLCEGGGTPGTVTCENKIEGVTNPIAEFGGNAPNDNSGVLRYLQVRYAGDPLAGTGDDLNGISFGAIGDGTTVDYVQVHNSHDDGVEFFGGTVNVKHLVLTGNDDDNLDTDLGYHGNLQFVIIRQRALNGDNGFEASNAGDAASPASDYNISNFTIVGGGGSGNAWRINSRSIGQYVNGVVDYPRECFRWESDAGDGVAGFNAASDPTFNSVLFDCSALATGSSDAAAVAAAVANDPNNVVGASSLTATFVNGTNETAVTPYDPTTIDAFFSPVTYVGAVQNSADRWWAGWSCGLEAGSSC